MQRHLQRLMPGWVGVVVGSVCVFLAASALSGCPGTLDPNLLAMASGSGGSGSGGSNSGGSTGSGGSSSGGSTGSGGSNANCTGNNDINYIMSGSANGNACAQSGCHAPDGTSSSGGLDLTLDTNIGSRLIGVFSGNSSNGSVCTSNGNYLDAHSNPATGLLIDMIKANPPCGTRMPYPGLSTLSAAQVSCVQAWAESLIMAAP